MTLANSTFLSRESGVNMYIAHKTDDGREQSVYDHLVGTAALSAGFAVEPFKSAAEFIGLIHDIGKYAPDFQKRINGSNIKFEHAICAAIETEKLAADNQSRIIAPMLEYCTAGHHTGLPDGGSLGNDENSAELSGRMKRAKYYTGSADYSAFAEEITLQLPDTGGLFKLFTDGLNIGDTCELTERYAFFTRYLFSCLTDADFLDTEKFFSPEIERDLSSNFDAVSSAVDDKLKCLSENSETELQKSRRDLLNQAIKNNTADDNILMLNMPTGSGKTLCSLKLAIDMIRRSQGRLKRVIYVIPYTSIIEQTADSFTTLFGKYADILQHHSNHFYDAESESTDNTSQKLRLACENWDAPFVITTSIQFFQSLYHYKSSSLRKLHNMAESVIVFDEIHLLPLEVLQPCLRGVGYITKYLGSKALFLSATMPDYSKLFDSFISQCSYKELIIDKSSFVHFSKCSYTDLGRIDIEDVIAKTLDYRSVLIVVNSRKTARDIYSQLSGNKYHLSTYMTPADRSEVISRIRKDLGNNVQVTVVSTSLIEAGVDLDFEVVFRQLAGLDSILQSGGRCNREGRRNNGEVFIFDTDEKSCGELSLRAEITKGLLSEFDDITFQECIREYYERLFYNRKNIIDKNTISGKDFFSGGSLKELPFRTYAEHFEFIKDDTVAVVVNNCPECEGLLEEFYNDPRAVRRKLQRYSVGLKYRNEFIKLLETGRIEEKHRGVFVLTDPDDYSSETGILIDRINDIII